jgi:hypothetical protein
MGPSQTSGEDGINPYIWCAVGGDFIVSMLNAGVVNDKDFSIRSLAFAVAGAVTMLLLLRLVRRVVGPLRAGKSKPKSR